MDPGDMNTSYYDISRFINKSGEFFRPFPPAAAIMDRARYPPDPDESLRRFVEAVTAAGGPPQQHTCTGVSRP
jgi:hypothetical protein